MHEMWSKMYAKAVSLKANTRVALFLTCRQSLSSPLSWFLALLCLFVIVDCDCVFVCLLWPWGYFWFVALACGWVCAGKGQLGSESCGHEVWRERT